VVEISNDSFSLIIIIQSVNDFCEDLIFYFYLAAVFEIESQQCTVRYVKKGSDVNKHIHG
jgi:hypothetical protein